MCEYINDNLSPNINEWDSINPYNTEHSRQLKDYLKSRAREAGEHLANGAKEAAKVAGRHALKYTRAALHTAADKTGEYMRTTVIPKAKDKLYDIAIKTNGYIRNHLIPRTKEELVKVIKSIIKLNGKDADLNCIDTSYITDMNKLFALDKELEKFIGDISKWDVSNVDDMSDMFNGADFNGDISLWDIKDLCKIDNMIKNSKLDIGDLPKDIVRNRRRLDTAINKASSDPQVTDKE